MKTANDNKIKESSPSSATAGSAATSKTKTAVEKCKYPKPHTYVPTTRKGRGWQEYMCVTCGDIITDDPNE